jgi:hypothetical protein
MVMKSDNEPSIKALKGKGEGRETRRHGVGGNARGRA